MLSGRKLKFLRIYKDKKANDLAKYLKVSKNYVSMLENEHQKIPVATYEKWIKWLNSSEELKSNDNNEEDETKETK